MEFTVIDPAGQWVVNPHQFAFVDPGTQVRFDPAKPVKVKVTKGSWLAGQMDARVIVLAEDPTEPERPKGKGSKAAEG